MTLIDRFPKGVHQDLLVIAEQREVHLAWPTHPTLH